MDTEFLYQQMSLNCPEYFSGLFKGICFTLRFLRMAIAHHLDTSSRISVHLGRMISDLSGGPAKRSRILLRHLMIRPSPQDPLGMLLQVLGVLSSGISIHYGKFY